MQRGDQVPLWLRRRPQFPPFALPSDGQEGALLQEGGCCAQMVPVRGAWTLGSRGRRGWGCLERAGHSRRPVAPHPKRPAGPCAAPEVSPACQRPRQPYLRSSRNRACGARRSLRVAPRTKQKLPSAAPLSALPARRRPRLRTKRNPLRLSEQRQGLPQWKLRLDAGSEPPCSHSLGCESPKPLPPTASPRRRLALTEVGSQSSRACATAPGFRGRSDLRPGLAGEGGERALFAVSRCPPQVTPTSFSLPPPVHSRPLPHNTLALRTQDLHSSLRSNGNS